MFGGHGGHGHGHDEHAIEAQELHDEDDIRLRALLILSETFIMRPSGTSGTSIHGFDKSVRCSGCCGAYSKTRIFAVLVCLKFRLEMHRGILEWVRFSVQS